mmetsp:Transcript_657/g.2809  ORF Transcript_657/g.2809 Transcript_657/m.2809 type:complete len:215 (+) Transcript_657:700-1344(+)
MIRRRRVRRAPESSRVGRARREELPRGRYPAHLLAVVAIPPSASIRRLRLSRRRPGQPKRRVQPRDVLFAVVGGVVALRSLACFCFCFYSLARPRGAAAGPKRGADPRRGPRSVAPRRHRPDRFVVAASCVVVVAARRDESVYPVHVRSHRHAVLPRCPVAPRDHQRLVRPLRRLRVRVHALLVLAHGPPERQVGEHPEQELVPLLRRHELGVV